MSPLTLGQEVQSGPWGRVIAPEPFEKTPFREIQPPAWLEEIQGVGYTLSVQSPQQRQKAIQAGVQISEMGFVDPLFVYYDSQLLKKRSPYVPAGRVEQEVAEYQRLGLRILGVYPPTLQGEVYELHPDWRRISSNTTEIPQVDLKQHPYGGMLCPLGPYGDFFIEVLAEITTKFPVDAFSFDGLHYGGVCYCEHCRRNYRTEMKAEIPNVNLADPAFRRYQHWADRRMENLVQRMQTRLKGIKPEIALVTWTTNAGRFGHFRDIPRNMPARMNLLLDGPDQEFWLDETNRGATVIPAFANAYIWATTNHRIAFSEPYLMSHGNPYGKDSFPDHEILRRVLLSAAYGVRPSLAVLQPENMQAGIFQALNEVQKRKAWLTHKEPEPWAALVMSDNTRVFYGQQPGKVEERYLANVLGVFRTTIEEHLPTTVICDWNLNSDDLAKYKVLILPNTACLSDRQMQAIRGYVRNGGGLVATLDTSLCDELGNPRDNLGLADLFGAKLGAKPTNAAANPKAQELDVNFARNLDDAYWEKRKNVYGFLLAEDSPLESEKLRRYLGKEPVVLKSPVAAVVPADLGTQVSGTVMMQGASQASVEKLPAVLTRQEGKGRVVYLPAAVDAGYYLYAYPYQRVLLKQAIQWAAGESAPVRVQAPMCVHTNVFRQWVDARQRLLIHLYNDVNTTAFHALPDEDVPLREEVLPIHDIRISLRGYRAGKIWQQPEGLELTPQVDAEGIHVVVPRLNIHSIIVVELTQ